jgi:HK97 family phage portal protein
MALQDTDGFIRRVLSRVSGMFVRRGEQSAGPVAYAESAAKPVTFDTAMQVSAFWACARLISETVAGLPLTMYRVGGATRVAESEHALIRLLQYRPNQYQNRVEFFETLTLQLCTAGNAYARIVRDAAGRIGSLTPMMAAQTTPTLLADGSVVYMHQSDDGVAVLASENVWHVKLFGNGIIGLSPLDYARNALSLVQAGESRAMATFRNGAKPSGLLMVDAALNKQQRAEIRASFADLAEGNTDSLIVLDKFMKYQAVSMTPHDVELLASRRFQMEDIARFMGVPSVLINDSSQATAWGTGIRAIIEGWYKLGLRPYLERFEASARTSLLSTQDREKFELEFDFDGLLRVDAPTRMDGYQKAINSGQMTPNEARMEEGRAPLAGGDALLIQGATVPLTMAGQVGQIPVKSDDERRDVNVVLNSAPISLTMPEVKASPVSVHVEAAVPPSPDPLSGSVVREVLERDENGTPMKTITRNVVDRTITEVVEWDDYGVPVRTETRPAGG